MTYEIEIIIEWYNFITKEWQANHEIKRGLSLEELTKIMNEYEGSSVGYRVTFNIRGTSY